MQPCLLYFSPPPPKLNPVWRPVIGYILLQQRVQFLHYIFAPCQVLLHQVGGTQIIFKLAFVLQGLFMYINLPLHWLLAVMLASSQWLHFYTQPRQAVRMAGTTCASMCLPCTYSPKPQTCSIKHQRDLSLTLGIDQIYSSIFDVNRI